MITLYEMFEALPRPLIELDIEGMFNVLLKKSIDPNVFMAEEADKTLVSMCRNLSENKMLTCLMVQKSHKSTIMRTQICRCISVIFIRLKQN